MTITAVIPRHGASLVRMTVVPTLSAVERLAWIAGREWPVIGAIAALVAIVAFGARLTPAQLDPLMVSGYLVGLVVTRTVARGIRRSLVRLEVATVGR